MVVALHPNFYFLNPAEKHLQSEQNTWQDVKVMVTREPDLGGDLEKEPLPPETVTIPDPKGNFCQLTRGPGLIAVDPFVI